MMMNLRSLGNMDSCPFPELTMTYQLYILYFGASALQILMSFFVRTKFMSGLFSKIVPRLHRGKYPNSGHFLRLSKITFYSETRKKRNTHLIF